MFIIGCKKIEFQNSIPLQILHHSLLYLSYSFFFQYVKNIKQTQLTSNVLPEVLMKRKAIPHFLFRVLCICL